MSDVEVSIVICTRNRAAHLDGALNALSRVNTERCWEIVLVDNGSTDGTAEKLQEFAQKLDNARVVYELCIGLGAARDRGWREAKGRIVSLTDDDCYLAPDYVAQIATAFAEHPDVGVIGGRILLFDPSDAPVTIDERDEPAQLLPRSFLPGGALHGANLSFRRLLLEQVGGIDPCLGAGTPFPCEDIDTVAKILWTGVGARYDPRPTVWHHHRRKAVDIPALAKGYDRGRGAYYIRFLVRPDTRTTYFRGWMAQAAAGQSVRGLIRLAREMQSAAYYLCCQRHGLWLLWLAPAGMLIWMGFAVRAVVAKLVRLAGRLTTPRSPAI